MVAQPLVRAYRSEEGMSQRFYDYLSGAGYGRAFVKVTDAQEFPIAAERAFNEATARAAAALAA